MYFFKQLVFLLSLAFLLATPAKAEQTIFHIIESDVLCTDKVIDRYGNLKTPFVIWVIDTLSLHNDSRLEKNTWMVGEMYMIDEAASNMCQSGKKVVLEVVWYDLSEQPSKNDLIAFLTGNTGS